MVVIPPAEARVVIPTTFNVSEIFVVSSSVLPSISTLPMKVENPLTLRLVALMLSRVTSSRLISQ